MNKRNHRIKSVVLPIVTLLLASSCTKSQTNEPATQPIRFSSPALTRSAINNVGELQSDGNAFSVWGWYSKDGSVAGQVFDHENVSWSTAAKAWGYEGVKYWYVGYTYNFQALFPATEDLGNATTVTCSQNGDLSIDNFDATQSHDLMIASQSGITPQANQDPGPVSFHFEHQLAKVTFQVKATGRALTVTSFKLNGVTCKADFTHTAGTGSTWSNPVLSSADDNYFAATDIPVTTSTPVDMLGDVMVPPHTDLSTAEITISYRYDYETTDRTATVKLSDLTTKQWDAGQQYAYTLSISAAQLSINVQIRDWEEENTSVSWK